LTCLTRKRISWNWSKNCQKAFETLKETFISTPIVAYWDSDSKIIVEMDVSDQALAAILSTYLNEDVYPIVFYSRTFSDTESNYDIYDKKLLAIFKAFKKWQ